MIPLGPDGDCDGDDDESHADCVAADADEASENVLDQGLAAYYEEENPEDGKLSKSSAQLSSLLCNFLGSDNPFSWHRCMQLASLCQVVEQLQAYKSNTSSSCAMQSPTHHNMNIVSVAQWNCMICLVSLSNEHTCWETSNMHASPEATPYVKKCHTLPQPQPHPPTHLRSHESLICRPLLAQVAAAITAVRVQLLGPNSLKTSSLNTTHTRRHYSADKAYPVQGWVKIYIIQGFNGQSADAYNNSLYPSSSNPIQAVCCRSRQPGWNQMQPLTQSRLLVLTDSNCHFMASECMTTDAVPCTLRRLCNAHLGVHI
jgi:hypothetical protein